jgi:hypothetical protein
VEKSVSIWWRRGERVGQQERRWRKNYTKKEIMKKKMGERGRAREGKTVLSNVTFPGRDAEMAECNISPR